jgi:hypothetical protein
VSTEQSDSRVVLQYLVLFICLEGLRDQSLKSQVLRSFVTSKNKPVTQRHIREDLNPQGKEEQNLKMSAKQAMRKSYRPKTDG